MAGNQGLQYNYICALSEEEQEVQRMGYPWVTTNHLDRNGVLGRHGHHSRNTHLIIRGSLTVQRLRHGRDAQTYQAGDYIDTPANTEYSAKSNGHQGCSFVEGHALLSPTTRDRIERNDVAKAIRTNVNIGHASNVHGSCSTGARTQNIIRICRYTDNCCGGERCNCDGWRRGKSMGSIESPWSVHCRADQPKHEPDSWC